MAQEGTDGGNSQTPEQQNARVEPERPAEELRQLNLARILTPEAKDRIGQYALLKPNMARLLEDSILKRAEKGHIISKVSNEKFISALEKIITRLTKETKVTVHPELETIRRREMAQQGSGGADLEGIRRTQTQEQMTQHGGGAGNSQTPEPQKSQEQAKRPAEELRQLNLTQMLTPEAKERLGQYAQLKPNEARLLEDVILKSAEKGHIISKVFDERFILALEKYITSVTKETNVTGNLQTPEQRKAQELAKRPAEELRQLNLTRILTPEAKERLGQYSQLKPKKARLFEDIIVNLAEKVHVGPYLKSVYSEWLISFLEKSIAKVTKETKYTVDQEFEDFVRQRLQEIKAERDGEMDNLQTPEQREAKRAAEELRQLTLTRMLTPKAKETLGQFALLRPNNARFIEDDILRRAAKGLTISESANATLVRVLEKIITKGNRPTPEQRKSRAKRRAEELRQLNLTRIMTPEAKERLARMAVKQPIKTRVVEDAILKYAEKGVRTKLSDEKLISLLEAMDTKAAAEEIRSALESTHI